MRRRFFALVMMITLMTASQSLNACASKTSEAGQNTESKSQESSLESSLKEASAETRMIVDLVGYIWISEKMYKDILWAAETFKKFDSSRTWENLQIARAALSISKLNIEALRFPESKMTQEDYDELMMRGADMSFLRSNNAKSAFEKDQNYWITTCDNMNESIMMKVYHEEFWNICLRDISLSEKRIEKTLQYLAFLADWTLASLNDDNVSAKLYSVMENSCPMTRARQASALKSPEMIEKEMDALMDDIEKNLVRESSEILSADTDMTKDLVWQSETGDLDAIREELMDISGLPPVIFFPAWYNNEDILYYWMEDGQIAELPEPGTTLERVPDAGRIKISNVKKEEVLDYKKELENAGIPSYGSRDEEGKLIILYHFGDSEFSIVWDQNTASILMTKKPVCFVPRWYPPAK